MVIKDICERAIEIEQNLDHKRIILLWIQFDVCVVWDCKWLYKNNSCFEAIRDKDDNIRHFSKVFESVSSWFWTLFQVSIRFLRVSINQ